MSKIINISKIPANKQTDEDCLIAVSHEGLMLQYVKNQTQEICLAAVNQNGCALEYVKHQNEEVCLAAVTNNSHSLQYVKNKTKQLCQMAVNKNGQSLEWVPREHQTEDLCLTALKSSKISAISLKNISDAILISSLKKDSNFLTSGYILDVALKGHIIKDKSFIVINLRERYKNFDYANNFPHNPVKCYADILMLADYNYIINLKNKIPEIFEQNIELMAVYEKAYIKKNININDIKYNNNKSSVKKF